MGEAEYVAACNAEQDEWRALLTATSRERGAWLGSRGIVLMCERKAAQSRLKGDQFFYNYGERLLVQYFGAAGLNELRVNLNGADLGLGLEQDGFLHHLPTLEGARLFLLCSGLSNVISLGFPADFDLSFCKAMVAGYPDPVEKVKEVCGWRG